MSQQASSYLDAPPLNGAARLTIMKRKGDKIEGQRMLVHQKTTQLHVKRQRRVEVGADLQQQQQMLPGSIAPNLAMPKERKHKLDRMEHGGASFGMRQLPDEQLAQVLQHFDLIERLNFQRVCKRWRALFSQVASTVYVKILSRARSYMAFRFKLIAEFPCNLRKPLGIYQDWPVQTLIVDFAHTQTDTSVDSAAALILSNCLARALIKLYIVNCLMRQPYDWHMWLGTYPVRPNVQVTFVNTLVSALPISDSRGPFADLPTGNRVPVEEAFADIHKWFIRIPEMTVAAGTENTFQTVLCNALWPSGPDAWFWLAAHASTLNAQFKLRTALDKLWKYQEHDPNASLACPQHGCFCSHLDVTHYEQLDGHFRRLLCLCVMRQTMAAAPPPSWQLEDGVRLQIALRYKGSHDGIRE